MALVEQYSSAFFNSTPELPDALRKHQIAGGNNWVHDTFGPIFRKHGVDKLLGIGLLHHHFSLEDDEFLTDVRGTSTPWKSQTGTRPSVWAFQNMRLTPLEFAMDDDDSSVAYPRWDCSDMKDFLMDLSTLFENHGVAGTYGLVRYPGDDFPGRVEMTVGRANVNLTPTQADKHDPASQSEAAWYFTDDFRKRGCACNCFHHGKPHGGHTHVPTITE
jgi:hypothetical protein